MSEQSLQSRVHDLEEAVMTMASAMMPKLTPEEQEPVKRMLDRVMPAGKFNGYRPGIDGAVDRIIDMQLAKRRTARAGK